MTEWEHRSPDPITDIRDALDALDALDELRPPDPVSLDEYKRLVASHYEMSIDVVDRAFTVASRFEISYRSVLDTIASATALTPDAAARKLAAEKAVAARSWALTRRRL